MKRIKYVCKKCTHVEFCSTKDKVKLFFFNFLLALGIVLLILVIILGPVRLADTLVTVRLQAATLNTNDLDLRNIVFNYTEYDGYNSFGVAEELVMNLPRIKYSLSSKNILFHDLSDTWSSKRGDCKEVSILFTALMNSVGYDAFVDCSAKDKHCVVRVPEQSFTENEGRYAVVDLTADSFIIYDSSVNHWKTPDNYVYAANYFFQKKIGDNY